MGSIIDSELQFFKSAEVSDASTNGGRMSANQIISGVLQNVFAHVFKAERAAGSTKHRKIFAKVSNDSDNTLYAAGFCLDGPTAGEDLSYFHVGTQRDTQADITGSERKFSGGTLNTAVSAGAGSIIVDVEDALLTGIFADGDTIRITDKADPDATGNEETHVINGAPTVSGTQVTITLTGTLANGYSAGTGTKIASVYEPGDISATVDNWVETSSAGTYDEATYPVTTDNIGTIEQTWTLTFSDATTFSVSGDTVGSVGSGTTAGDFSPNNPDWTKPYFTLLAAGWGGTWAAGDTIVFQTHPAAIAIWETRVVPAGCASLSNNKIIAIFTGETI